MCLQEQKRKRERSSISEKPKCLAFQYETVDRKAKVPIIKELKMKLKPLQGFSFLVRS